MTPSSKFFIATAILATTATSTSWSQDEGRWCSEVGGAHSQQLISTKSEVDAECDGGLKGQILNDTPIKEITVEMRSDVYGGKTRYATFAPENLTADDTDVGLEGGGGLTK